MIVTCHPRDRDVAEGWADEYDVIVERDDCVPGYVYKTVDGLGENRAVVRIIEQR